ncbi:MAG: hypothetical protein FJX77_04065, partial [Armatimonadetes bacterium]|nr:hypothetical protein [Armatimonadota bacterium]
MCDPHESSAETAAAVQAVAGVLQTLAALEAGSIPRSRLFLKEAVSVLRRAGRTADACLGYRALAHLELRRGHGALAVRAARSALRLARDTGIPADQDAASSLLATVLHSAGAAGEAADAARDWLFRTRSQGDLATEQSALLLVAVAAWDDGRPAEALGAAEEAVQLVTGQGIDRFRADLILAGLLSRAGCVRYGAGSLGRILKRNPPPRDEYLCRLERGWTRM